MILIRKSLTEARVRLDIESSSKKRLFEQIGLIFENECQIGRAMVFDALFAREKLGSTGLGYGVAIPHGRIKNLKQTLAVFLRAKEGIPFDSPDGQPVRVVFAMLVPEHATEEHLNMLSELAQMFGDEQLRARLEKCGTPAEALEILTAWSPYGHPEHPATV